MSVLYSLIPFNEKYHQEMSEYLAKFGVEIPLRAVSRYPSPNELRQVLDEMPEYTKSYNISENSWDIDIYETAFYNAEAKHIGGKYATIYSTEPSLDDSLPIHIYFHGGWDEVNLEIVLRLTKFTGPLVMMAHFDGVPLLVSPDKTVSDLLEQWARNREV